MSSGLLDQSQFNFTYNASNDFPSKIKIQILAFNTHLNVLLNKMEGLIYNSSIYSKVSMSNGINVTNSQTNSNRLVSEKNNYLGLKKKIIISEISINYF